MTPPNITFSTGDSIVLFLFFAVTIWIGASFFKKPGRIVDFLLGGRTLTLPIFVLTLFSTWYGGVLGIGEFGFTYGISSWVLQGVPYYAFGAIFAVVFAKRARRAEVVTIPDQLFKTYGRNVSLLGAVFTGILSCPAPYVLMVGILLQIVTGWALLPCLIVTTLFTIFYLWFGGFKADVATDIFYAILMLLGFIVILPFLISRFGGIEFLQTHLPPLHMKWHGGNSVQMIVMWFFIALWTFIEPTFYQRCYAAKSERVAVAGILISILFWFAFDVMTITAALYSKAIFQNLDQPMMAYPLLAQLVLPTFWKGLFFAGMFATVLSTLNSQLFVSATSIGRDFFWKLRGEDEKVEMQWIQIGMVISSVLCIWLAYNIPSVVKLWYSIGTVIVPGLLIAMVSTFFPSIQISKRWIFFVMLGGFLTSLVWLAIGWRNRIGGYDFPFGIEPMFPGLFMSILIWLLGRIQRSIRGANDQ